MTTPGRRAALRLARRDAVRHRVGSLLVLTLLTLPVLAVSAALVVWQTSEVSSGEAPERRLGAAAALVEVPGEATGTVVQGPDPEAGGQGWSASEQSGAGPATLDEVLAVLGERSTVPLPSGWTDYRTDKGVGSAEVTGTDLRDPLTDGLFTLLAGRLPERPGEVVVNPALADRGPAVGDTLEAEANTPDGPVTRSLEVVGLVESTRYRDMPMVVGLPASFPEHSLGSSRWLVGGPAVSWADVRAVNEVGALVTSRAVLQDPPPTSALAPELQHEQPLDQNVVSIVALIVAMVLIEVVLLAGPAFAVSARRQARTLALIAASGGTPVQARRVVLASGLVFGLTGAVIGVVGGIAVGWALLPLVQRWTWTWMGPFDVPWSLLVAVAGFGLLSGLLAAIVPAWSASRQDPVAVLAGRRGDARPSRRSPVIGLALVALAIGGAALGAGGAGELLIAASAVVAVLGMILLVPVAVVAVARLGGRLPLALRFAARDAARHRTRTVPAVAAVAATVAGVVALGIATTSDEAQNRVTYTPALSTGAGAVTAWGGEAPPWPRLLDAVRAELPAATVTEVRGVPEGAAMTWTELVPRMDGGELFLSSSRSALGGLVVGDAIPDVVPGVSARGRERAAAVLAAGGAAVFADEATENRRGTLVARTYDEEQARQDPEGYRPAEVRAEMPLAVLGYSDASAPMRAVLSPEAAAALGLKVTTLALAVDGDIPPGAEKDVTEAVRAVAPESDFFVERGYQAPDETVVVQLVLAGLGAVLMLGGTLTATFLALSDARPDLATMAAVGAAPRTRRAVAAAYALVVGLVGSVLGAAIGFIPGIAVTYPLTRTDWLPASTDVPSHVLDVPWAMITAVVLGLPLLTAALVGLAARSRLPMVARLE